MEIAVSCTSLLILCGSLDAAFLGVNRIFIK